MGPFKVGAGLMIPAVAGFAVLAGGAASISAEVPLTIAPTGHATVPVEGSFGTDEFVFDTGAEGSAVYAGFADAHGLDAAGTISLQGQTGVSDLPLINIGHLVLDGFGKSPIEAVRLPPRADGASLAGVVGHDLFGDRMVDFNLPQHRLSLRPSGGMPPGVSSEPIEAKTTLGMLLTIPVTIGEVEAVAVLDTGARKTRINWALGRLLQIDREQLAEGETVYGATNVAVETGATSLESVRLGSRELTRAPVLVADLPVFEAFGVANRPAIILGLDWLTETRMVIDFPARKVWFEPQ